MDTIPTIINVAELQRNYRKIVNKAKRNRVPVVVVSNGEPDMVLMDITTYDRLALRTQEMEEYLVKARDEALKEYREGKTIKLGENRKLKDLIY